MHISTKKITLLFTALACSSMLYAQSSYKCSNGVKYPLSQDEMQDMLQKSATRILGNEVAAPKQETTQTARKGISPVVTPQACDTLVTTFAGGNGHDGNMFDVTAINTVTINQFSGAIDGTSGYMYIYYKAGSYAGSEATPSAWTLVDSAFVTSNGVGVPTLIPINIDVVIPAGQTYAFYVTGSTALAVDYTNGTTEGAVYKSDANIEFKEGKGVAFPFASTFTPRIWNGIIHYCEGSITGISNPASLSTNITMAPNPMSEYTELNLGTSVDNAQVRIFDILGKEVRMINVVNAQKVTIPKNDLDSGVYFVNVIENGKTVSVKKLVVK